MLKKQDTEQPRCATLLLLDTSGSMIEHRKIDQLNEGMRHLKEEILKDELASGRVDIAVVTFGDGVVNVVQPFTSIRDFQPPILSANGDTPMGEAILQGIDIIETRTRVYREQGLNYYRPWIFMITDGEPTDMNKGDQKWTQIKNTIEDCEKNRKLLFFSVGIEPANMILLNDLMPLGRRAIKMQQDGDFRDMFQWLSNSQEKTTNSDFGPNEMIKLEPPEGWGELKNIDTALNSYVTPLSDDSNCEVLDQENVNSTSEKDRISNISHKDLSHRYIKTDTNNLKNSVLLYSSNENSKIPILQSTNESLENLQSSLNAENLYENAQFTVYRPSAIIPEKWYSLLFFAHLSERPTDAKEDDLDPLEEVERQAKEILNDELEKYLQLKQDSSQSLPKEGQITIALDIDGIVCNPPEKIFYWYESVHREIFRIKTTSKYINKICRGRISVYFGSICVAEIQIAIKVSDNQAEKTTAPSRNSAQVYRKIFASYSHSDEKIVEEFEKYTQATGDKFLRDSITLRTGEIWNDRIPELIKEADIFQLFWSNNSMYSQYVQQEWEYALTLNRPYFIRPVFWDDPLPEDKEKKLPPQELLKFHFHKLRAGDVYVTISGPQTAINHNEPDAQTLSQTNPEFRFNTGTLKVQTDSEEPVTVTSDKQFKASVSRISTRCPKPDCNTANSSSAKYCKRCGADLKVSASSQSLPPNPVHATTYNSCSACGEVNPPASTFCRNCGSPLKKTIPRSLPHSYPVTSDIQTGGSAKDRFSQIEVASPEQPHSAILFLLDTSGSMIENRKLEQLNEGIRLIKEEILRDEPASSQVDIAVVTFGDGAVNVVNPFTSIRDFQPPFLSAKGDTSMGDAILKGIDLIETRKKIYRDQGVNYFRPWIFMITDGEPTDMKHGDLKWANIKRLIEDGEKNGKFMFFTVGVEPANMNLLNGLMPPSRGAIKLRQDKFRDMFLWLSKSEEKIVRSDLSPGEGVKLESIDGWGELFLKNKDLVFISAKSEDYVSASRVYSYLTEHGYSVFFSDQTLPRMGNSDYRREIDRALEQAKHMIVVTSRKEYVGSAWVEAEWGSFINEKRSGRKQGNIITLIAGSIKISDLPASLRYYAVLPFDPTTFDKILKYLN